MPAYLSEYHKKKNKKKTRGLFMKISPLILVIIIHTCNNNSDALVLEYVTIKPSMSKLTVHVLI